MRILDLQKLQGWRRRGLAALLGVFAVAALPPFYLLLLLIPSFSGLFLLVHHAQTRRQAFLDGWWWGLGYFTAGLYWICISLWVPPATFWWFTPFALFGLPAILGVYIGIVTLALHRIRVTRCASRVTLFAGLWVAAEYLRSYLFTGFPWNLIGYVWTVSDATLQFASIAGIYGLSWITVMAATMPALWVLEKKRTQAVMPITLAWCMLGAMTVFGVMRLEAHPTRYTTTKARIVQANVEQSIKWESKSVMDGLRKQVRLTRMPGLDSINIVLWPETAVPYYVTPDSDLTRDIGSILPQKALLITGGMRAGATRTDAWNSVFAIDGSGSVRAEYDKHHLVPFGEYIPLRDILPVHMIVGDMGDFARGPGPKTLDIPPYPPFSPLVCYEAIFPEDATDGTHRAQWLFSLTDDAWFGKSAGPLQDVEMARTRAVEQGLPMLRASNTGVSAAFDAYGRTIAWLPLEKEGVLDLFIPAGEADRAIFSRYPHITFLLIAVFSFLFASLYRKNNTAFL